MKCDIHLNGTRTGHTTVISFKKHFWLGFSNTETAQSANKHNNIANDSILLYSGICPFGLCNQTRLSVDLTIQNDLCIGKRKGQLCSECEEGLSVVFGSTCLQTVLKHIAMDTSHLHDARDTTCVYSSTTTTNNKSWCLHVTSVITVISQCLD